MVLSSPNVMYLSRSVILSGMFASSLLLTGCFATSEIEEMDDGEAVSSTTTSVTVQRAPAAPAPVVKAPAANTSCEAQSCGEDGEEATCLKENGCICGDEGCKQCKNKRENCTVSAECCSGLGMECVSVTVSTGATEKRCMPVLDNVCKVSCSEDRIWGAARSCTNTTAPEDTIACDDLVGESCTPPTGGDRNEKSCVR